MNKVFVFVLTCILSFALSAEVKLPSLFSDNMVLQRDQSINVWGWANKNETVTVTFNGQKLSTKADKKGNWKVTLKSMAFGGPFILKVQGKNNTIIKENILLGDVWLCSGQSNMEFQVKSANNAKIEIATADFPEIRSFNVIREMSPIPKSDLKGNWEICSSNTVGDFSAVAYFFARKLYQEIGIPIGIINSSWGGTDIETWISPDAYRILPENFQERYSNVRKVNSEEFIKNNAQNKVLYLSALEVDFGLKEKWYDLSTNISNWENLPVPGIWKSPDLKDIDGVVWLQYDINLPESVKGKSAVVHLGKIDDNDDVWINGIKVGSTIGYDVPRMYKILPDVLHPGTNRISIRVVDTASGGGLYGEPNEVFLETDNQTYSLSGMWRYKISESNKKYNYVNMSPNIYPSLLYNAMINPLIKYAIKGTIWYQGENNAKDAVGYRTLFPSMITDWRKKWGYDFPFYWVQLANYMTANNQPEESYWAELREAQTFTLSLPKTGQAVIIDIGDATDIHPKNKQDVGLRLALNALNKNYGKTNHVFSGPMYKSIELYDNKIIISFDYIGSGLDVHNKYGYINGFSIAGLDGKFVWAKAYIDRDKVVVYSDKVKKPVMVRYNWANNPDGNLYNKEGLPTCPFRSDKM